MALEADKAFSELLAVNLSKKGHMSSYGVRINQTHMQTENIFCPIVNTVLNFCLHNAKASVLAPSNFF